MAKHRYTTDINHMKPNYYRDGKFYLIQCWNCNDWKQNKEPESGVCQTCGWSFYHGEKNRRNGATVWEKQECG